jgi:hypothetical protein
VGTIVYLKFGDPLQSDGHQHVLKKQTISVKLLATLGNHTKTATRFRSLTMKSCDFFAGITALIGALTVGVSAMSELQQRAALYRRQSHPLQEAFEGYAFLYFTGGNEQISLAASNGNDALSFTALNDGQPILSSTEGDRGVRDPFIMRSVEGDKFFILATDLCIQCGTSWYDSVRFGSRHLEIWESEDLITFTSQRHVLVSPESYGNSWAPEAYYDTSLGAYVVYWSSAIYDDETNPNRETDEYQRVVYTTTTDFITFTEPAIWQDEPPFGRIDATVIREGEDYFRFTKATVDGCADIVQETSTSLTATLDEWTSIATCIGINAGTAEVEGPAILKTNPTDVNGERFILFVDEFGGNGYVALESDNIAGGQWSLSNNYSFPTGPRHGTVLPLTGAELNAIVERWGRA